MTAKNTSSAESFKTVKQALQQQQKSHPKTTPDQPHDRRETKMAKQQASDTAHHNPTLTGREQMPLWMDGVPETGRERRDRAIGDAAESSTGVARAEEPELSAELSEVRSRHSSSPVKVEPDPEEARHPSAVVATAGGSRETNGNMATEEEEANITVGPSVDTKISNKDSSNRSGSRGGSGGAAIPVSPPSSPAYVATQHMPVPEAMKEARGAGAETVGAEEAKEDVSVLLVSNVTKAEVESSSGVGKPVAPTKPIGVPATAIPPSAGVPSPAAATTVNTVVAATDAGSTGDSSKQTQASAIAAPDTTTRPPPPVKLGRGRKLCPNCHALTKSAVKQCRECNHIFSPACSRLRPAPRADPKEIEDLTVTSRRRLRPSQRLIEYECEAVGPSSLAPTGASGGAPGAVVATVATVAASSEAGKGPGLGTATRRPLATNIMNAGGGGANLIAASGVGGGGKPAAAGGAGGMTKKSLAAGTGGSGAKSAGDGAAAPPKRSHKRKVPLPPGVAPPKRKKGAAAAAAAAAAATAAAGRPVPSPPTNGPDRTLIARNLLAQAEPKLGPAIVPTGGPSPSAVAPGPLLFLPSASTPDDHDAWPAQSSYLPSGHDQQQLRQQGLVTPPGSAEDSAASVVCPSNAAGAAASWRSPTAAAADEGDDLSASFSLVPQQRGGSGGGDVIDLLAASQDKDPFEGVELWLGDERRLREQQQGYGGGGGGGAGYVPAVSLSLSPVTGGLSAFPVAVTGGSVGGGGGGGGGYVAGGGPIEQRALSLEESMELLGDGDLMWSPSRTTSAESSSNASTNSTNSLWQDVTSTATGINYSLVVSRGSPAPEFDRVAALASTSTADLLPRASSNAGGVSCLGRSTSLDLHGLLGYGSSSPSSSLEPLAFGTAAGMSLEGGGFKESAMDVAADSSMTIGGDWGGSSAAWAVVNRGCPYSNSRVGEGGGGNAAQHQEAFVGGTPSSFPGPSVVGM